MKYDIIVIGAGSAGLSVASGAAQLGLNTALIEGAKMGGDCLNYGCIPSKALIKAGKAMHSIIEAKDFGIEVKGSPKANWEKIKKHIQGSIDHIAPHDSQERFEKLGVDIYRSYAKFLDESTLQLEDKTTLTGKKIVIATGSHAFIPPIPGIETIDYLTNETVFSMETLPERLMVIGTGPIGCELGQTFQRLGIEVSMLNRSTGILGKDDSDISEFVQAQMEKDGISFYFSSEVQQIEKKGKEILITVKNKINNAEKLIVVDQLLMATGRKPSIDKLDLDKAGIVYDKKGIKVDASLRTNKKHIFAIGDCNGHPQFTHNAGYQAGLIIRKAIFKLPTKYSERVLPYATYTTPPIATVGLNETTAKKNGINYILTEKSFEHLDRAVTDGTNVGKCKILLNKKGSILGASIVGTSAPELIHEIALAMHTNTKATTLTSMTHAYPTLSEIVKQTISAHYSKKLFSPKIKKVLKLIFGYGKNR